MPKVALISGGSPDERERILALAPKEFEVEIISLRLSEDEIVARAVDCDFILAQAARVPARLLREASRLKLVHVSGQGFDHIPLEIATERGIPVANIGGSNAVPVAEHAVMLMLAVSRRLLTMVDILRVKRPHYREQRSQLRTECHQLEGKTVGIVGLGNQGRRVCKILHAFEANTIFVNRSTIPHQVVSELQTRAVTFEELLRSSDIVTLHVPLDDATQKLIGWEQLNMMKPSAILINCSRGPVVDEAALIRALKEGIIAGAGLDVFEKEPPTADNPLLSMENVVATPHVAGLSHEEFESRVKGIWENIYRVWQGQAPYNVVNKV
ncbi:MAG: hydroxyacid dehydrogenase [Dehalococcoidales bacterium]|nr:hydroxyacid dehydrogenase [Dehalococcoidales bacterium]